MCAALVKVGGVMGMDGIGEVGGGSDAPCRGYLTLLADWQSHEL